MIMLKLYSEGIQTKYLQGSFRFDKYGWYVDRLVIK